MANVAEVLPGWVYTKMTKNADKSKIFWATTADKAANQIYDPIRGTADIRVKTGHMLELISIM